MWIALDIFCIHRPEVSWNLVAIVGMRNPCQMPVGCDSEKDSVVRLTVKLYYDNEDYQCLS